MTFCLWGRDVEFLIDSTTLALNKQNLNFCDSVVRRRRAVSGGVRRHRAGHIKDFLTGLASRGEVERTVRGILRPRAVLLLNHPHLFGLDLKIRPAVFLTGATYLLPRLEPLRSRKVSLSRGTVTGA